jgi:hypothetical protein
MTDRRKGAEGNKIQDDDFDKDDVYKYDVLNVLTIILCQKEEYKLIHVILASLFFLYRL